MQREKDLTWRLLLLGAFLCAIAAAATPYVTLKLGMSVDLTLGGMFLTAWLLGRYAADNKQLGVQLNIIQTMITVVAGIGFMVVILAAFYYIQNVFGRDVDFHPERWQMILWLAVSAVLGVFMGVWPRRMILNDRTLPWPTGKVTLSVAQTLTDPEATETVRRRRNVLTMSTAAAGFLTFLKDGLGVITPMVGNGALKMSFGLELAAFGIGMYLPLAVGLSGLLGVWFINSFGETVAQLAALSGTAPQHWGQCYKAIGEVAALTGAEKDAVLGYLTANCGSAMEYVEGTSHFKLLIQWMMWPATAMMIAAALTSVALPLVMPRVRNLLARWKKEDKGVREGDSPQPEEPDGKATEEELDKADEHIPLWWTVTGTVASAALLIWMTSAWFSMPWQEALLAVAIQPVLIIAGLRVLATTGSGPVSLMANATQFLFGLLWPAQVKNNLAAAYVSANPQASSEAAVPAFWVAQRLGGRFRTLVIAMLVMIPIGAILTPFVFDLMVKTYGIGTGPGQLTAPTGLKIASLALVMEKGVKALPHGALTASVAAIFIGVLFELLRAVEKDDGRGNRKQRFWWVPVPAAFGFALILPPSLTLGLAFGSVAAAVWRKLSPAKTGSCELYSDPLAAGLVAGEAIVGAILLPLLAILLELVKSRI